MFEEPEECLKARRAHEECLNMQEKRVITVNVCGCVSVCVCVCVLVLVDYGCSQHGAVPQPDPQRHRHLPDLRSVPRRSGG